MIDQVAIAILGPSALLISQTRKYAKYACFIGLLSQPFWFYASYVAAQWGIFGVSFLYLGAWCLGLWNHWLSPKRVIVNE